MKLRYILMFIGCFIGGLGGFGYWYSSSCLSGNCATDANLSSVVLYGVFIGLFVADLLSQGMDRKEA